MLSFLNMKAGVMYGYHCAGAAHLLTFLKFLDCTVCGFEDDISALIWISR
jgi:hypothetical protein